MNGFVLKSLDGFSEIKFDGFRKKEDNDITIDARYSSFFLYSLSMRSSCFNMKSPCCTLYKHELEYLLGQLYMIMTAAINSFHFEPMEDYWFADFCRNNSEIHVKINVCTMVDDEENELNICFQIPTDSLPYTIMQINSVLSK